MSIYHWIMSGYRLRDYRSGSWAGWHLVRGRSVDDRGPLTNPLADVPCGARKGTEHDILPEPIHHECRDCHDAVKAILIERYRILRSPRKKYQQGDLFPDLHRKQLKP